MATAQSVPSPGAGPSTQSAHALSDTASSSSKSHVSIASCRKQCIAAAKRKQAGLLHAAYCRIEQLENELAAARAFVLPNDDVGARLRLARPHLQAVVQGAQTCRSTRNVRNLALHSRLPAHLLQLADGKQLQTLVRGESSTLALTFSLWNLVQKSSYTLGPSSSAMLALTPQLLMKAFCSWKCSVNCRTPS